MNRIIGIWFRKETGEILVQTTATEGRFMKFKIEDIKNKEDLISKVKEEVKKLKEKKELSLIHI